MTEPIPINITGGSNIDLTSLKIIVLIFLSVVSRVDGFRWHPPWSWIKPPKLYVRIDSGKSEKIRKTREIKGTTFEWNDEIE